MLGEFLLKEFSLWVVPTLWGVRWWPRTAQNTGLSPRIPTPLSVGSSLDSPPAGTGRDRACTFPHEQPLRRQGFSHIWPQGQWSCESCRTSPSSGLWPGSGESLSSSTPRYFPPRFSPKATPWGSYFAEYNSDPDILIMSFWAEVVAILHRSPSLSLFWVEQPDFLGLESPSASLLPTTPNPILASFYLFFKIN